MPSTISPQGFYNAARIHGELVVSAGMTPRDGEQRLLRTGMVGGGNGILVNDAAELAGVAAARAVDACETSLPTGAELVGSIWLTVYIRSGPEFEEHSTVADGASLVVGTRIGGERPVRAAVGVVSLPGGAPVEVQLACGWSQRVALDGVRS